MTTEPITTDRRTLLTGAAIVVAAGATAATAAAQSGPAMEAAVLGTLAPPAPLSGRVNPQGRFLGKVVLITGATSGIGRTTAECFAREGAKVAFCGRRENLGADVERGIKAFGGEATYIKADVRDDAQVRHFVDAAVRRYGGLDIAFNNAGYFMDPDRSPKLVPAPVHEMSDEHWAAIMDTNAGGVFRSMRAEIPVLLRQNRGGVIVNMASVSGHVAFPGLGGYAASKHAILGLTKIAATELAEKNIRVVSISPLSVDTPMITQALAFFKTTHEQSVAGLPFKRSNTTDEMARAIMFLASSDAASLGGMDLDVTGGWLAK